MTTHVEGREYDIIFAGGGAAACVTAGRLAKADPNLSILIIEYGRNNYQDPLVTNPLFFFTHLAPGSTTIHNHVANKSDALNGRQLQVQTGGILGGGGSVNLDMYIRASGADFDSWNTEGWDAKSLIPLARRLETFHPSDPAINKHVHGYTGPIHASHGPLKTPDHVDDVLQAAAALGYRELVDLQDFEASHGFGRFLRWSSPQGVRSDTAHGYIHPLVQSGTRPNLHLLLESCVHRVIFEGTRAVGIEYSPRADSEANTATPKFIKARKLVVVSAGALGSPPILERSGVGCANRLRGLSIPLVSNLPDVGEHYMDHNGLFLPYRAHIPAEHSLDPFLFQQTTVQDGIASADPRLAMNGIDVGAKLRPTDAEAAAIGPAFLAAWKRDFEQAPTRPVILVAIISGFIGPPEALTPEDLKHRHATVAAFSSYPYSRGSLHIVARDPNVHPSFDSGFLTDERDVEVQVWMYKKMREVARRMKCISKEVAALHPSFREGSRAVDAPRVRFDTAEQRRGLPVVEYDADDDAVIEDFVRSSVTSTWHSMGTVRMAPREEGGCLDKHLNVYGTQGLKVADLSICPKNMGGNTYNTAMIIGEKAADIIARELGFTIA